MNNKLLDIRTIRLFFPESTKAMINIHKFSNFSNFFRFYLIIHNEYNLIFSLAYIINLILSNTSKLYLKNLRKN